MRVWQSGSVRGFCLTLLCLLSVLYPLLAGPGPVNTRGGGDSPFLLVRLEQLVAGLRSGAFPVRWMPDAAYGLGYPFFTFYAALPYYVAAGFRLLGWGPIFSLQITQVLGFVLAAAAMALYARRVFRHPAAVALVVVAYTCAPFHLVNVYVRGDSLSEFYAFVFYPLIFWALHNLCSRPSRPGVAWLALSLGGLVLTHNLSALIYAPFVAAWAVFMLWPESRAAQRRLPPDKRSRWLLPIRLWWRRLNWQKMWWVIGSGILGLALSASLWLTILDDLDSVWMGVKDIQTSGHFNYAGHLRGWDLVQPSILFDYEGVSGHTPFAMGALQAILVALGIVAWGVRWLQHGGDGKPDLPREALFWVGGLALSTFMMTPASLFLWDHVPVLPIVQFPWRFLSVQAFFAALIIGAIAQRLPKPWLVAAVGTALLTFAAVGNLCPEYTPIDESDVTAERLALFESFTTDIGTTIRGEYLPLAVEPRPWASAVTLHRGHRPSPVALTGEIAQSRLMERDARSERWQVMVVSDRAHLAFYTLYFPGWRAYRTDVDRTRQSREHVEIEPLPGSGLISIWVPHGEHTITLCFGRTTARWIADGLSLAAGLIVLALLWPLVRTIGNIPRIHISMWALGGVMLLGMLVLLGRMLSVPRGMRTAQDLSMDFGRMPFLHHNPDGIDFGARARLESYAYPETVRGGGTLTATLRWASRGNDLVADLRLVPPADVHPDLTPAPLPLAGARTDIEGARTIHALSVPVDAASGMYYVALRVYNGQEEIKAVNVQGYTLGTVYLRPVWVDNPRPARESDTVLARFGDRILLRDDVQVEAGDTSWNVALTWQATAPIPVNYSCSLHALSAEGVSLAQHDFEGGPGYGFWPTSAWPVGEWLTDRLRLPIPDGIEAKDAVALSVTLYDRSQPGFPAAGSAIIPFGEREHQYEEPPMKRQIEAVFGEQIKLLGYDLGQDVVSLRLTLHWQALGQVSTEPARGRGVLGDYRVFVHLFDPATETIVAQSDARPLNGTYPTNWWRPGEVVSDTVALPLTDVPVGTYRLAVGLYSKDRLSVVTASGEISLDGRLILEEQILVPVQQDPILR